MKQKHLSGGMIVFLGALCWSLNAPVVKFLVIDSLLICGLRSAIAAATLVPLIRPKKLHWNIWMLLYVSSYASLCLCIVLSLKMTSAPIAIGMQYSATIWLFLLSTIQTGKFDKKAFLPIVVILIGVGFFMSSGTDSTSKTGNLLALTEGISFAVMTVSSKKAAGENPLGLTALANLFTAIVVFAVFPSTFSAFSQMTAMDWVIMLILGFVQVAGGYGLYTLGVQHVTPQKASIIALWEMILGPLWVAIFLKEYPSIPVLIGFAIIMVGMIMDAIRPQSTELPAA